MRLDDFRWPHKLEVWLALGGLSQGDHFPALSSRRLAWAFSHGSVTDTEKGSDTCMLSFPTVPLAKTGHMAKSRVCGYRKA